MVTINIFSHQLLTINLQFVRAIDNLIVDISKITYELNIETTIFKVSSYGIESIQRPGMADMALIINSNPAGIYIYYRRIERDKFFFFTSERIIYMNGHIFLLKTYSAGDED